MKRTLTIISFFGSAILLYCFFLPAILMLFAPKTDMGDGHSVIFFPPHADPYLRWYGVMLGAVVVAAGSVALLVTRDRQKPSRGPAVRLLTSILAVVGVVSLVTVQSYVAQLPDHLSEQFQIIRLQAIHEGLGLGWPSQQAVNTEPYSNARGTIEVVIANPAKEHNHAYVQKLADKLYRDWRGDCLQAALLDGATFSRGRLPRPREWTAWPVVDPAKSAVYLSGQTVGWTLKIDQHGTRAYSGNPP